MYLLVGLGNPGQKYIKNRHNIGFITVGEIAHRFNFSDFKEKFKGLYTQGTIAGEKVVLLMPMTYMNLSGESVQAACQFFKIDPDKVIVFHDELDLEPLRVKIKVGGGNGGHNGLKSIQQQLGTANFKRVRIGIGHPGDKNKVSGYVLSDFAKAEVEDFADLAYFLASETDSIISGNEAKVVSDIASRYKK